MAIRWLFIIALLVAVGCDRKSAQEQPGAKTTSGAPASERAPTVPADPREEILAKGVHAILAEYHLLHRPVDDDVSRRAFDEYLKRLDGQKLYLLSHQVEQLRLMADEMDDQLRRGSLLLARRGEALLIERQKLVARLVEELLAKPLDLSNDETIETDTAKLSYCNNDDELRDRWRRILELQVLERIATMGRGSSADAGVEPDDAASDDVGKESRARAEVATTYRARFERFADRDPLKPVERFLNAIMAVYDPHTSYLAPAAKENFDIDMTGSLEGIGAVLAVKDHLIEVRELVAGGASWRQGELEPGDLIMAVTPKGKKTIDISDMSINRVVALIRGPKGTVVTLRVQKRDGRVEDVSITRDVIIVEEAYARGAELTLDGATAGYIMLPSFYGNTRDDAASANRTAGEDVRKLLAMFQARKLAGAIIDLRSNGGGLLTAARDIAGHFIETGPIVQIRDADGSMQVIGDKDRRVTYTGEVVVLVDRFSASGSEILAGALQDYRRAVIIGTGPTHGKGTVQNLVDLARLTARPSKAKLGIVKVTTQQYFLVDGDSTQARGVKPDIVLPDPTGYYQTGERYLDHFIPWSETKALHYVPWKATWDVKTLADSSAARTASNEFLKAIVDRNKVLERLSEETVIPLKRGAWLERRKRIKDALAASREALVKTPRRCEVKSLVYARDNSKLNQDDPRMKQQFARWRGDLSRDVWVHEALLVLGEMR